MILRYDNAPWRIATRVEKPIERFGWENLHDGYFPDYVPLYWSFSLRSGTNQLSSFSLLQKCAKISGRLMCFKIQTVLLVWNARITQEMGKYVNNDWSYFESNVMDNFRAIKFDILNGSSGSLSTHMLKKPNILDSFSVLPSLYCLSFCSFLVNVAFFRVFLLYSLCHHLHISFIRLVQWYTIKSIGCNRIVRS